MSEIFSLMEDAMNDVEHDVVSDEVGGRRSQTGAALRAELTEKGVPPSAVVTEDSWITACRELGLFRFENLQGDGRATFDIDGIQDSASQFFLRLSAGIVWMSLIGVTAYLTGASLWGTLAAEVWFIGGFTASILGLNAVEDRFSISPSTNVSTAIVFAVPVIVQQFLIGVPHLYPWLTLWNAASFLVGCKACSYARGLMMDRIDFSKKSYLLRLIPRRQCMELFWPKHADVYSFQRSDRVVRVSFPDSSCSRCSFATKEMQLLELGLRPCFAADAMAIGVEYVVDNKTFFREEASRNYGPVMYVRLPVDGRTFVAVVHAPGCFVDEKRYAKVLSRLKKE